MYKHGSLLALFCFRRMCITVRDKNRFVDHHTQYGMETVKGHSFFVARNAHEGFNRISGWIKITSANGEKRKVERK